MTKLVEKHVNGTWEKTHFLSFTADRNVAELFASGPAGKRLSPLGSDAPDWDTAILTLDTRRLSTKEEEGVGIYRCTFKHRREISSTWTVLSHALEIEENNRGDAPVSVMFIDVLTVLNALPGRTEEVAQAIRKAERDHEWLILPLDPFEGQLTAKLDDSCISRKEKFKLL